MTKLSNIDYFKKCSSSNSLTSDTVNKLFVQFALTSCGRSCVNLDESNSIGLSLSQGLLSCGKFFHFSSCRTNRCEN